VYFLPLCFDHLIAHENDALDLVTTPVWFVSEYDEDLTRDGLRNAARERIHDCLSHWTNQFRILHFDLEVCRRKGWDLQYQDCVQSCEVICQCTEDLHRFKNNSDIALEFFQSLAAHGDNPTKAAWFLELARACEDVYTPPDDPEIRRLLANRDALSRAAAKVRNERLGFEMSPTYWNDTFNALSI
jgi:hypothetical protein